MRIICMLLCEGDNIFKCAFHKLTARTLFAVNDIWKVRLL